MKGSSFASANPRRTVMADSTWPSSEPKTVSTAASRGSSTQAQNDMATMPKAKPDRPCTNPAAAAPSAMMKNMPSMVCLVLSFWVCKTPEFWNACISRNSFVFIVQYGFAYDAPRLKPCRNTPLHRPLPNWPTAWPRA